MVGPPDGWMSLILEMYCIGGDGIYARRAIGIGTFLVDEWKLVEKY
jgi:hypothetical protein